MNEIDTVIRAIWDGAVLKSYQEVDDLLAQNVLDALGGLPPIVMNEIGPPARRRRHVLDCLGRVIIMRVVEHGQGGKLQIRDAPRGWLSRRGLGGAGTLECSGWSLHNGWIVGGGGSSKLGIKRNEDSGAPPTEVNEPPTPKF